MSINTTNQYQAFYITLKQIIEYLNNPTFPKLDEFINKSRNDAIYSSYNNWFDTIPKNFLLAYYGKDEDLDDIRLNCNEYYSVPYLHLSNNDWAKGIVSKSLSLQDIESFKAKNIDKISKIEDSIVNVLKFYNVPNLDSDEEEKFRNAKIEVSNNVNFLNEIKLKIEDWNKVRSTINITYDFLRLNDSVFRSYFKMSIYDKSEYFLDNIAIEINEKVHDLSIQKIGNCRKEIKNIWKKLKKIAIHKKISTLTFQDIKPFLKNINIPLEVYFDKVVEFYEFTNQDLKEKYNITESNVKEIKFQIDKAVNEIKLSTYPRIDPDNITDQEIELLSLLKFYKSYPDKRDKEIELLKAQMKQIMASLDQLHGLASGRYEANYLNNEEFLVWLKLEHEIYLDYAKVKKLLNRLTPEPTKIKNKDILRKDFIEHGADYASIIEEITEDKVLNANISGLPKFIYDEVLKTSLNINGMKVENIRRYQKFAAKYILTYKNVLLGDEMGLGKTIEALTVANHLSKSNNKNYTIVICPYSILANWKREIAERTHLNSFVFHGENRKKEYYKWKKWGGILLTNYEQCKALTQINDFKINFIVVDEAHNIKNPKAQRTQSVEKLLEASEYKLLMTGTPLENKLDEMKQLISFLNPQVAKKLYRLTNIDTDTFKNVIATVYLRRKRKDVLRELPSIEWIEIWSTFTKEQQKFYDQALDSNNSMGMRQAAFIGEKCEKIEQIKQICEDAHQNHNKVLIFSYFRKRVTDRLQKELPYVADFAITGDIARSTKRDEIINKFSKSKEQTVLISQIKAGGVGLNIQAANIVILCEPQWKPSIENQAISRVYRMGQTKNVRVYHLLTENSIDETMMNILQYKQTVFDTFADESLVEDTVKSNQEEKILEIEKKRLIQRQQTVGE